MTPKAKLEPIHEDHRRVPPVLAASARGIDEVLH